MLSAKIIAAIVSASAGVVVVATVVTLAVVLTGGDDNNTGKYVTQPIKNDPYMTNEMDTLEVISSTPFSGKKPEEWQMKYTKYPYWGCPHSFTDEEKQNIINENQEYMNSLLMHANKGTLRRMPESLGGDRQFEATGVNWEADRLKIRYGLMGRVWGQRAVAWAFPGEIVTVEFPKGMDLNGIVLGIGKCNRNPERQWLNVAKWKTNNRMPIDSIGFDLGAQGNREYVINNTVKIGSPFGGMIYLRNDRTFDEAVYINFTNVGRAPIINYNITTNEEWNKELKNAPGNVAEIRTPGNRFVFTSRYIRGVEDAQFLSDFWFKAICVSDYSIGFSNMPITMHYDERVDAGAAVSFVGAWFTQHPSSWAAGVVDKNSLINYGGWGSLHEMNHQKQGSYAKGGMWGMGNPTEETNNALTSMTYILYTNIAGNRHNGLSGWNYVSDGYSTIREILNGKYDQSHLKSYVNLVHAFGTDALMNLIRAYYGTWYTNNYESTMGVARNTPSAFCLLAAGVIKRDTRYFCSLFNYEITETVSNAIKNMSYPTYFPFFNFYAMSYNGNVYGRPYKLRFGVTTRLNFATTTAIDPKATDVVYTIKSGLTKGTLVKVEENIYDYTPLFRPDENDTFVLSIDCKANGEQVHIEQEGTFYVDPHIILYDSYKGIDTENMDKAISYIETVPANNTNVVSTFFGISKYNYGAIRALFVERGKLVVPETGYYTLFMKVDDKGRLLMNVAGEYEQLMEVETWMGSYSRTQNGSFYTLKLEKGKDYPFILYNLNIGGQGFIQIGYCYHGTEEADINVSTCSVADVGSSMIYHENATTGVEEPEFKIPDIYYSRSLRYLTNEYRVLPYCKDQNEACFVKCLSLPLKAGNEPGGNCFNLFDGKADTYHHTPWTTPTIFPIEYSFEFAENITFNHFYAHHRRNIDAWGYFEVYVRSLETGEMELLSTYHHPTNAETNLMFSKLVRTDRVDFKVYNNSAGNKYVALSEISFNIKANAFTSYTNSYGPDIVSNGFKKVTTVGAGGGYLVVNEKEGEGSLCFRIQGKRFGLYGVRETTSGKFRITIDSEEVEVASQGYFSHSERTLFYTYEFDEEESESVHEVCMYVIEGTVNLDMIGSA